MFDFLETVFIQLYMFFFAVAQELLSWGHKAVGLGPLGDIVAIYCYTLTDYALFVAQECLDAHYAVVTLQVEYDKWIDGTRLHEVFQAIVTLIVDEFGEPSTWFQREVDALSGILKRAIFDGQNNYGFDFWDQLQHVLVFFYDPGRVVPYLLDIYNHEWWRLFEDTLGWLRDRLADLGWVWPDWLDDPVTWLHGWLETWGLFDFPWPDDILAWLWEWLLSTAEDTFERIASPFQSLSAKMLRYMLEGVFKE